jgi:hypothetical protein
MADDCRELLGASILQIKEFHPFEADNDRSAMTLGSYDGGTGRGLRREPRIRAATNSTGQFS